MSHVRSTEPLIAAKVKDLLSRVGERLTPVCRTCGADLGTLHFIECPERKPNAPIVSGEVPFGAPGSGGDAYYNEVARLIRELRELVGVPVPSLPERK